MNITISIPLILWLWSIHWIGDFVCQTDEMAKGKSTSNRWLSVHVCAYTLWIAMAAGVAGTTAWGVLGFILINGALHWFTDYVTSRINARNWAAGRVHEFFVGVGADQCVHLWTLVLTAYWLL